MIQMLNVCWKSPGNLLGCICRHPVYTKQLSSTQLICHVQVTFVLVFSVIYDNIISELHHPFLNWESNSRTCPRGSVG